MKDPVCLFTIDKSCNCINLIQSFCLLILCVIGWANNLVAGPMEGAKGFNFFICSLELTESGLGIQVVPAHCFARLCLLDSCSNLKHARSIHPPTIPLFHSFIILSICLSIHRSVHPPPPPPPPPTHPSILVKIVVY